MDLLRFIKEPKSNALDAPETTLQHRDIILRKPFLRKLYVEWYKSFVKIIPQLPEGKLLEIGAGGGFLKDLCPSVITSDILPLSNCDMTFSAENMPFEDNSISAIFMIDVLHHIPDCELFFAEAQRVLIHGGIIFMIEPANTNFSRFIYKNLHHEPFKTDVTEWNFPSSGPLSDANGALPWIIFSRDLPVFQNIFNQLELKKIKLHTPFRYLITGGLSYKSIVPGWSFTFVTWAEYLLFPIYKWFAMFQTITVSKK